MYPGGEDGLHGEDLTLTNPNPIRGDHAQVCRLLVATAALHVVRLRGAPRRRARLRVSLITNTQSIRNNHYHSSKTYKESVHISSPNLGYVEAPRTRPISRPRGALDTYDRWNMEHADGGKCSKGARMRRSQSPGRAGASTPSPHLLNQSTSELLGPRITQASSAGCTRVRGTLRGAFQRGIDEYFKPSAGLATFGTLFFPWQNCCTD